MTTRKLQHVNRRLTDAERTRHTQIREAAMCDIPRQIKFIQKGFSARYSDAGSQGTRSPGTDLVRLGEVIGNTEPGDDSRHRTGERCQSLEPPGSCQRMGLQLELIEMSA